MHCSAIEAWCGVGGVGYAFTIQDVRQSISQENSMLFVSEVRNVVVLFVCVSVYVCMFACLYGSVHVCVHVCKCACCVRCVDV